MSSYANVGSGVAVGSVLWPNFFLFYINVMPEGLNVRYSQTICKWCLSATSESDAQKLQTNIDTMLSFYFVGFVISQHFPGLLEPNFDGSKFGITFNKY